MNRKQTLDAAAKAVLVDRNSSYGDPEDNFRDIAAIWNVQLEKYLRPGMKLTPHMVAALMISVKVSRLKTSPGSEDHWVDIAGYAACGAEAQEKRDFARPEKMRPA